LKVTSLELPEYPRRAIIKIKYATRDNTRHVLLTLRIVVVMYQVYYCIEFELIFKFICGDIVTFLLILAYIYSY